MNENYKNVRVLAEPKGKNPVFNIYMDFSGRREYLTLHRHNGILDEMLKDGMHFDDMRRWKPSLHVNRNKRHRNRRNRRESVQLHGMVRHLLLVIDDYMLERAA